MMDEINTNFESLTGKFLISSPYSFSGDVFNKSLIYIATHTPTGAMGLIVNHLVNKIPAKSVLKLFKEDVNHSELIMSIYLGGPVEPERGFILHTPEYNKNLLLKANDGLAISSNIEILQDIANGKGPNNSIFVLGYTGWGEGQIESEIAKNLWIVADISNDIIFNDSENKWVLALNNIGIDNSCFSPYAGNC